MKTKTEENKDDVCDLDEILDAIKQRDSAMTDDPDSTKGAAVTHGKMEFLEDYYAQACNVPSCHEADFFPPSRKNAVSQG